MILHANYYDLDDRSLLVRYNQETDSAHWAHPSDGSPHGSSDSDYVTFQNVAEAIVTAQKYGYLVIKD